MTDALGLTGLRFVGVCDADLSLSEAARRRVVEVETTFRPSACPGCGEGKLHKHSPREQHYADVPHLGEPTQLLIRRQRWRCTACGWCFSTPVAPNGECPIFCV